MHWPFWSLSRPAPSQECGDMELLLSPYVDGMASSAEIRRVEAHLPGCPDCAAALSLIQATRRTLAARPVVAPPPELHSRIALAIAASAAPVSLRPARSFTLRPAYAAAASVSLFGLFLGYSMWHATSMAPFSHTLKTPHLAAVSPHTANIPSQARLPHRIDAKRPHPLVAFSPPLPVKSASPIRHAPALRRIVPVTVPGAQEHIAQSSMPPRVHSALLPGKTLFHAAPVHEKLASNRLGHAETRLPAVPKAIRLPKPVDGPKLASRAPASNSVPVNILSATVTPQPEIKTTLASRTLPESKLGDILGPVRAHIGQMRTVSYLTPSQVYRGADAIHTLDADAEHFAYLDAIHSK